LTARELTSDQVFEIAASAVDALVAAIGTEATFPFDRIWHYADVEVPGPRKPATANRLLNERYLELTGNYTAAESEARAGSPTREYRAGPRYRRTSEQRRESNESVAGLIQQMASVLTDGGFIVRADQLANFYLALRTSPFVILAGRSGTGKSLLPRYFAQLTGASFYPIQVQPQWSDNADLMGFTPTLDPTTFRRGRMIEAMLDATDDPGNLVIALLDEMNLAHVEHYFSDFLSVIESRRRAEGGVVTDVLPLDLPDVGESDAYSELRTLIVPHNIRVIGTANMDETTHTFSPKVLDRAFTIEFDEVDLAAFATAATPEPLDLTALAVRLVDRSAPVSVTEVLQDSEELFAAVAAQLVEVNEILEPVGASFAYRTRDAVCLYLWHWKSDALHSILPFEAAMDYCLLQKVLPHVRGYGELLDAALASLIGWLERDEPDVSGAWGKKPYLRSAAKVAAMQKRLREGGATSFWTT
jgi:MoxR-like ATPase